MFAVDLEPETMYETVSLAREAGAEIATHTCDVTDSAQVAAMVKACVGRFRSGDCIRE